MKKIIKILIILLIPIGFVYNCTSLRTITGSQNRKVLKAFKEAYPDENFYFIYGLDYKIDLSTNIRYRGIIYSDRLAAINYPGGVEVAFSDNINVYGDIYGYESIFKKLEMDEPIKEKIRELFGDKTILENNVSSASHDYEYWKKYKGKNLEDEKKLMAWNTIVNVFIDDLDEIEKNETEYRRKVFELGEFMYKEMNIKTSLQVYFRDKSFFKNYEIVNNCVFKPFRNKAEVKNVLEKIKNNEDITEKEEIILINNFYRSLPNYDNVKDFTFQFKRNTLEDGNIIFTK